MYVYIHVFTYSNAHVLAHTSLKCVVLFGVIGDPTRLKRTITCEDVNVGNTTNNPVETHKHTHTQSPRSVHFKMFTNVDV